MTTPAMTTEQAFAALTQLVTYNDKIARHTNADVALGTLRAEIERLTKELDKTRSEADHLAGMVMERNTEIYRLEREIRAAMEGEGA